MNKFTLRDDLCSMIVDFFMKSGFSRYDSMVFKFEKRITHRSIQRPNVVPGREPWLRPDHASRLPAVVPVDGKSAVLSHKIRLGNLGAQARYHSPSIHISIDRLKRCCYKSRVWILT